MIRKFLGASFLTVVAIGSARAVREESSADSGNNQAAIIGCAVVTVGASIGAVILAKSMFDKN